MKNLIFMVVIVLVTVGILLNVHIIRYDGGAAVRAKNSMTLDYTYVDLTNHDVLSQMLLPKPVARFAAENKIGGIKKGISDTLDNIKKGLK